MQTNEHYWFVLLASDRLVSGLLCRDRLNPNEACRVFFQVNHDWLRHLSGRQISCLVAGGESEADRRRRSGADRHFVAVAIGLPVENGCPWSGSSDGIFESHRILCRVCFTNSPCEANGTLFRPASPLLPAASTMETRTATAPLSGNETEVDPVAASSVLSRVRIPLLTSVSSIRRDSGTPPGSSVDQLMVSIRSDSSSSSSLTTCSERSTWIYRSGGLPSMGDRRAPLASVA